MKILAIHNFHRKGSASGDDQVFRSETKLLQEYGHEVVCYTVQNDSFDNANLVGKIVATFGMLWSVKNFRKVKKIIKNEAPDVVHIHTFFPLLSPSILYAAKKSGCKVVTTLHDTRFVCPCATSLRDNNLCNKCSDGKYLRMVKYGCFKKSKVQSLIVALIFSYHRKRKTFYEQIDKYICLNDNQIELLLNAGFDKNKIIKKYNFIPDKGFKSSIEELPLLPSKYVVFYGRLGEEKGIRVLQEVWDGLIDIPLVVMGGGPLEVEFAEWAKNKKNIYYLGYTEHSMCLSIVKNSQFVVFPSIWYEGCSMVEIETQSLGKALVATDLGFSVEAIEHGINGLKFPLGDIKSMKECILYLWNQPDICKSMGTKARKSYENNYLPDDNYNQLIKIYESL